MSKLKIKDLNGVADVYRVPTSSTGATITGSLENDIVVIDGQLAGYSVKASGNKLTISGVNDFGKKFSVTVTFDKKGAAAQATKVVFADGAVDFAYSTVSKAVTVGGALVGKQAVGVGTLPSDPTVVAGEIGGQGTDPVVTPVQPKTFTLTTGVDQGDAFKGTSGADTFDARINPSFNELGKRLDQFDKIDGGDGIDTLIVGANTLGIDAVPFEGGNVEDIDFTGVKNIENVTTAAFGTALGEVAAAAGIKQFTFAGRGQFLDIEAFNADLVVKGTAGAEEVDVDLSTAGIKTLNLGADDVRNDSYDTVFVKPVANAASGSVEVRFVSAEVGNGADRNVSIADGKVLVNDEGTILIGNNNQFKVQGINADGSVAPTQNRGNFSYVVLGSDKADAFNTNDFAGEGDSDNVYINAGAGADTLSATAFGNQRHFLVGGTGDDVINVQTSELNAQVVVLAGADNDKIVVAGGNGFEDVDAGAGNDVVDYVSATVNVNYVGGDILNGGDGRDTLVGNDSALRSAQAPTGSATYTMSNFEAVTVVNALNGNLTLSNLQKGIDTVTLNAGITSGTITFDVASATVNLNSIASGTLSVATAGSGTADQVTVNNTAAAIDHDMNPATALKAVDAFAGRNITAFANETSVIETVVINTSASGTATKQTVGAVTGAPTVKFVGANAVSAVSLDAKAVDASGLTTAGLEATLAYTGSATGSFVGSDFADSIKVSGANTVAVNTGKGNDTVEITSLSENTIKGTLNGGDGRDTLKMSVVDAASATAENVTFGSKVSGFEVLSVTAASGTSKVDLRFLPDVDTVISAGTTGTGVVELLNVKNAGTVELTGTIASGTSRITVKDADIRTTDSLTLAINSAGAFVNTGTLTIANIESLNIVTKTDGDVATGFAPASLKIDALQTTSLVVSGNRGVNFSDSNVSKVVNLDASGVNATGLFAVGADAATKLAAAGEAGAVVFATGLNVAQTIKGGNGNDVFTANGDGVKNISGGAGNDFITSRSNAADILDGGDGDDVIIGAGGNDTITGGAGNDVIIGGAGADRLAGGAGNDIFVLQLDTDSTLNALDVISDFKANTVYDKNDDGSNLTAGGAADDIAKRDGDVIELNGDFDGSTFVINVSVVNNVASASAFLQSNGNTTDDLGAALDSTDGKLYLDINSDGVIDSVIQLTGVNTITSAAFDIVNMS